MKSCFLLAQTAILFLALAISGERAVGADKKTPWVAPVYYRMNRLEEATKLAATQGKPIAWIASFAEYLAPYERLMGTGSHAATAYAFRALQNDAIIVFSDARTENHQEPAIVDQALHTPEPHYTVPGVIILTPNLDKVIFKTPMVVEPGPRVASFTEALKKIRDKASWQAKP
jgi:hypothetical protein